MSLLLNGDCLEEMKQIEDNSIDLVFCDLPYATKKYSQVSCKWNTPIDLDKFWIEIMRIKKLNTPIFMTCTTKFGGDLINSCPKKCRFRYDIVWCKSSPAGFLSAKKMPMRKHEMVYVFYEKLPFYDLSSHKHKFLKPPQEKIIKDTKMGTNTYDTEKRNKPIMRQSSEAQYSPPLPTSVVKEQKTQISKPQEKDLYGATNGGTIGNVHGTNYDPPLPVSVVKEDKHTLYGEIKEKKAERDGSGSREKTSNTRT